ncbi:MAG: hypothetical protein PHI12_01560 [Dehalococcoidales bacterium]|nr:hypothetical protein [Dehalococcoidales bacterium]
MDDIRSRIERGRKAIKIAGEKGMDTSYWEKELAQLEVLAQAEDAARRTGELWDKQGWCLWKCSALDDDIIVVCRDEVSAGYPKGYPVYIEYELDMLGRDKANHDSLRLIHEAKKLAGARVIGVEGARRVLGDKLSKGLWGTISPD